MVPLMKVIHGWGGHRLGASLLCAAALCSPAAPARAQQVYVGTADQWNDLLAHPEQWQFVRRNADGFYLNFIEMEPTRYANAEVLLKETAGLFTHKNAYFESDYKLDGQDEADDDRDIALLQGAGFTVPYTSLNTGWDLTRYRNLKSYQLRPGQPPRLCLIQDGPWTVGGDINGDVSTGGLFPNATYRRWSDQGDGDSTDGPLGFWSYDPGVGFNKMQAGSYSLVNYAHARGKLAVVMLCPYGAGINTYNAKTMFVATGEDCVRGHEDHDAEPDVYAVFEYATDIGAVPEQVNGAPAPDSTTAMAYYLIKHLHGDPGTLRLSVRSGASGQEGTQRVVLSPTASQGRAARFTLQIADTSPWLDYAAVLRATRAGTPGGWSVRYLLHGRDITQAVLGRGFEFYRGDRVEPKSVTVVDLSVTRASARPAPLRVTTYLLPHHDQPPMGEAIVATPG